MKYQVFSLLPIFTASLTLVKGDCGWMFWKSVRTDCRWGVWSSWSSCSHMCGNAGTITRSRNIETHAKCGGNGCSGPSSEVQNCNRFCHNGGIPRYGYCSCSDVYWGTCCEKGCSSINHCERIHCTTGTDQQCRRCSYDRGGNIRAYRPIDSGSYKNRICQKLCSWRPDSRKCYPGICVDVPDSCRCAPGFMSPASNCMTIIKKPDIMHCLGKVEFVTAGEVSDYADVSCDTATPTRSVYTNIPANRLAIDWLGRFVQPSATAYPKPYYVQDFKTGIVKAHVKWEVMRGSRIMHSRSTECNGGYSRDNPNQGTHTCHIVLDIGFAVAHADKLVFTATVFAGGFIKLNNYDDSATPTVTAPRYYTGTSSSQQGVVTFDSKAPVHCSVIPGCMASYLDVGPAFTKQEKITAKWFGWTDQIAGIIGYKLAVYRMKTYGDLLGNDLRPLIHRKFASNVLQDKVDLVNPGLYCFLLTIDDGAGNHIMARKFVMYDKHSKVEVLSDNNKAMVVLSAAVNTSHTWITDLTQKVALSWKGHFINKYYHLNKLLNAIRPNSPPLSANYEDRNGSPPSLRSMQAIPNVNGVTSFEVQVRTDHAGARNVTDPLSNRWSSVDSFQSEQISLDVSRKDGDSIRLFVRGWDVMANYVTDSTVAHVDSSPPELTVLNFVLDGKPGAYPWKLSDAMYKLDIEAFDPHSGLDTITYELYFAANLSKPYELGSIPVREEDNCDPTLCTCVPATNSCYYNHYQISLHAPKMADNPYQREVTFYFMVTIINNAKLVTKKRYKVHADVLLSNNSHCARLFSLILFEI